MNSSYPLANNSDYEVMITANLSTYDQKTLLTFYMPIIGNKVLLLYQTLYSLVKEGAFESDIAKHEHLVRLMHLKSIEKFYEMRIKLEAVRLLEVFYKDGFYVYLLQRPLTAQAFLENRELATLLEYQLGHDEYEKIYLETMMRKLDINKFNQITLAFDDVYQIEASDTIYLTNNDPMVNNGIVITNKDFDFEQFMILTSAHEIIHNEYFSDQNFINTIKRYSFLYKLNPEEMKDVIILSCDENKKVNYDDIRINAKKMYEKKNQKLGLTTKNMIKPNASSNNKLIRYLESASPSDFVKNKTGVALISSEIDMFDRLLKDTNISLGVLNVLIGKVLDFENLNGEIPPYNYFLKIINTWKRAGVKTTVDAINYVSNKNKTSNSKNSPNKKQKGVPDWYDDYIKDLSQKTNQEQTSSNDDDDLEELKKYFRPDSKE